MNTCHICYEDTSLTCNACDKPTCPTHHTTIAGHSCGNYRIIDESVERGLLNQILATPEDDGPRLAYSDWLQEQGEYERGEWIANHIAKHLRPLPLQGYDALSTFLSSVYTVPASPWIQLWHGQTRPDKPNENAIAHPYTMWAYERGFVVTVWCSLENWYRHGTALVTREPIKRVNIVNKRPWGSNNQIRGWFVNGMHGPAYIGSPIGKFLYKGKNPFDNHISYSTHDVAMTDLSDACIDWAKAAVRGEMIALTPENTYVPPTFVC